MLTNLPYTSMWLALDIGNSAVKGGLFSDKTLQRTFRLHIPQKTSASAWCEALRPELEGHTIKRTGVTSVVPEALQALQDALPSFSEASLEIIHPALRLPFQLAYETPETLGTDRLAAAAAGWILYGAPSAEKATRSVVVIDAGTALTYEVISGEGVYYGGAIGPGPRLLRQALQQGTAQLPGVSLELPTRPIGRSTSEALQSGIMHGFLDGARGMIERLSQALQEKPFVVATGGWGAFLHQHLEAVSHVEPHLVLQGICLLLELNSDQANGPFEP